jgi:hypothetical protein
MLRQYLPEPYLPALTAAWVVGLFTASTAPLQDLWRPLLIGVGIAVVLGVIVRVVAQRHRWVAVAIGAAWMLAIGAWPFALLVLLVALWRAGVDRIRARQARSPVREAAGDQVTRILRALAAAALVVVVFSLATSGAIRIDGPIVSPAALDVEAPSAPSIYLVLLDGYPATDTLEADFGFDNSAFLDRLDERGFDVASSSHSNYNRTLLTLASMLHMEYVEEIEELGTPSDGFSAQTRQLSAAINQSPVPGMLADAGYRTVAIGSSYGEATLVSADEIVDSPTMTMFEEQLLRYTTLGAWIIGTWPELVAEQHRRGVLDTTAAFGALAREAGAPTFALAHVFSPHTPFVFNADGSPRPPLGCYPRSCGLTTPELARLGISADEYADGLTAQVTYLNDVLVEEIDRLLEADPDAVVILFSDHGARYEDGPADEHFRTFLAARTPGQAGLFGDDVSPIDVFPRLFQAYFGATLPEHEYRAAWAPDDAPLETTPVELTPDR